MRLGFLRRFAGCGGASARTSSQESKTVRYASLSHPTVLFFAALVLALLSTVAPAAERIRIAAQKTGTLAWELSVIKAHGLDAKAGIDLVITELAAPEAGKIALKGGSADVIVTDLLWVARGRALGGKLKFYPYG